MELKGNKSSIFGSERGGLELINLSLYYDLFFSSVGFLCGGILIFQGWRLDPILLLCQILLSGTTIFFISESLWLRANKIKLNTKLFSTNQILSQFKKKIRWNTNFLFSPNRYQFSTNIKLSNLSQHFQNRKQIYYIGPIEY